jgi:hypothetical protein
MEQALHISGWTTIELYFGMELTLRYIIRWNKQWGIHSIFGREKHWAILGIEQTLYYFCGMEYWVLFWDGANIGVLCYGLIPTVWFSTTSLTKAISLLLLDCYVYKKKCKKTFKISLFFFSFIENEMKKGRILKTSEIIKDTKILKFHVLQVINS